MLLKGFAKKMKRAPRTIGAIQRQKRAVYSQLKTYANLMNSGWYNIETQIAYRAGASPPQGLMDIKGHQFNRRRGWRSGLKAWVINRLIPPNVARLRGTSQGKLKRCDQILVSFLGDVKLFTADRSAVYVRVASKHKTERLLEAHQVLGKYVPVTKLEIANDEGFLRETFAAGRPLHLAPREVQCESYRRLIEGYTRLTREQSSGQYGLDAAERAVEFALKVTRGLPVNGLVGQQANEVRSLLGASPLIPSHGDLSGNNVLVSWNAGAEPVVVDLEQFGTLPFLFDILTLPIANSHHLERDELILSTLTGKFDDRFNELFYAAGLSPFSKQRVVSLLAVLVVSRGRETAAGGLFTGVDIKCIAGLNACR